MVAIYCVPDAKDWFWAMAGDHETVPVYWAVLIFLTGVAPATGAVTPGMAVILTIFGNTAVTTPKLAAFVACAPATVKKSADTPCKV